MVTIVTQNDFSTARLTRDGEKPLAMAKQDLLVLYVYI